ncbi:hypothetical protein D3C86_1663430 [compost metagenome]
MLVIRIQQVFGHLSRSLEHGLLVNPSILQIADVASQQSSVGRGQQVSLINLVDDRLDGRVLLPVVQGFYLKGGGWWSFLLGSRRGAGLVINGHWRLPCCWFGRDG